MKKVACVFGLVLVLLLVPVVLVSAAPAGLGNWYADCLYIDCQSTQLGRCTIVIPVTSQGTLSTRGQAPVNITATTITGRVYYGVNLVNERVLRFAAYTTAEYQPTVGNATYAVLTVTAIYETNVNLFSQANPISQKGTEIVLHYIEIFLHLVPVAIMFFYLRRSA